MVTYLQAYITCAAYKWANEITILLSATRPPYFHAPPPFNFATRVLCPLTVSIVVRCVLGAVVSGYAYGVRVRIVEGEQREETAKQAGARRKAPHAWLPPRR